MRLVALAFAGALAVLTAVAGGIQRAHLILPYQGQFGTYLVVGNSQARAICPFDNRCVHYYSWGSGAADWVSQLNQALDQGAKRYRVVLVSLSEATFFAGPECSRESEHWRPLPRALFRESSSIFAPLVDLGALRLPVSRLFCLLDGRCSSRTDRLVLDSGAEFPEKKHFELRVDRYLSQWRVVDCGVDVAIDAVQRAVRAIESLAASQGLAVVFVRMPIHSRLRERATQEIDGWGRFGSYLGRLASTRCQLSLERTDSDSNWYDSLHLDAPGAVSVSELFHLEPVTPCLQGVGGFYE